jgi:hypothetical protein
LRNTRRKKAEAVFAEAKCDVAARGGQICKNIYATQV